MSKLKQKILNKNILMALITTAILVVLILTTNSSVLAFIGDTPNIPEPSVNNISRQGGYGGGGGEEPPPGTTDILGTATTSGTFIEDVTAYSEDQKCSIFIPTGTTGLTTDLEALTQLSIVPMTTFPTPPSGNDVIGIPYDFGPSGATFDPPITITFTYDLANIPEGVDPADLKLAFYDSSTGTWVELTNVVIDPVTHTISGETDHFTIFTVVAHTVPATLTISNLTFSPAEIIAGEMSTISVTVTNSGDLPGTYDVVLKINTQIVETKTVILEGHTSTEVVFSVIHPIQGSRLIDVNGLTSTLKIVAAPTTTPTPTPTTPTPAPTTTITPTPTTTITPAITPTVTPEATTTAPAPTPTKISTNWGIVIGVGIAAIIVLIVLIYLLRQREA